MTIFNLNIKIPVVLFLLNLSCIPFKYSLAQETIFQKNGWRIEGTYGLDRALKNYKNDSQTSSLNGYFAELGVQKVINHVGIELSTRYYRNQPPLFDSTGISSSLINLGLDPKNFLQKYNPLQRASASIGPVFNFPFLNQKAFMQISVLGGISFLENGLSITSQNATSVVEDNGFEAKSMFPNARTNFRLGVQLSPRWALAATTYYTQYFGVNQRVTYYNLEKSLLQNTTYNLSSYGAGLSLIYSFGKKVTIPEKEIITIQKNIKVTVRDSQTNEPLAKVKIKLSSDNGKFYVAETDEKGEVMLEKIPQAQYHITGMLNEIASTDSDIFATQFDFPGEEIAVGLIHHDPRFTLKGFTINKNTKEREGNVYVVLTNLKTQAIDQVISAKEDGEFSFQIDPETDYDVFGRKDRFISEIESVTTKGLERNTVIYVKLAVALEETEAGKAIELESIYYDLDKADIREDASRDLNKLVQFMKDNPGINIELNSHTDSRGSSQYNLDLSQRRAESVVNFLIDHGIDENRLHALGYGESQLTNECADSVPCTEEQHQANRRTEFMVVD